MLEGKLTLESINDAIAEVDSFLKSLAVDSAEATKVGLSVEEALLRFRDEFGEKQDFVLKTGKYFGKIKVTIEVSVCMIHLPREMTWKTRAL